MHWRMRTWGSSSSPLSPLPLSDGLGSIPTPATHVPQAPHHRPGGANGPQGTTPAAAEWLPQLSLDLLGTPARARAKAEDPPNVGEDGEGGGDRGLVRKLLRGCMNAQEHAVAFCQRHSEGLLLREESGG